MVSFCYFFAIIQIGEIQMSADRKDNKPKLKPIEGNRDLYAFVNLERNPPEKKAALYSEFVEDSKHSNSNLQHKSND
jgi:hypothetical protein